MLSIHLKYNYYELILFEIMSVFYFTRNHV